MVQVENNKPPSINTFGTYTNDDDIKAFRTVKNVHTPFSFSSSSSPVFNTSPYLSS